MIARTELHDVRESLLNVTIGALSIVLACTAGSLHGGLVYWTVGPALFLNGVYSARARRRLLEPVSAPALSR